MLLVISVSRLDERDVEDYRRLLHIPENVPCRQELSDAPVGKQDRVILVTPLDNEGDRRQRDFIRNNRDVGEWLVFSENTTETALEHFRNAVSDVPGVVFTFSQPEALREKLRHKPVRSHACLIAAPETMKEEADLLWRLMMQELPGWSFETAIFPLSAEQLSDMDCGKLLLIGKNYADFRTEVLWPDNFTVFLVCTDMEAAGQDAVRFRSSCFSEARMKMSKDWQEEHFFVVDLQYEAWRRDLADGKISASLLARDPDFVIWDTFGLPCAVTDYTEENIRLFLNRFDGCARLAAALR